MKIFGPQIKKFKNTSGVEEISAHLKNHENSSNKCKRSFWNPGAFFFTHFGFSMNLRLKFQHNFLVKNGLPWPKFRPLGGFLGVGEVGQLHFTHNYNYMNFGHFYEFEGLTEISAHAEISATIFIPSCPEKIPHILCI